MPGIVISGLDENSAVHPIAVDDNGNLRVDLVSGVSVSTVIDQTNSLAVYQTSGTTNSVNVVTFNSNTPAVGLNETTDGVLRVVQMTDSVASVNVVSGSILVNEYTEESTAGPGDGTLAMGVADANGSIYAFRIGSGLMDRALRTVQAADSVSSVSCVSVAAGLNETNAGVLRTVLMTDSVSSVSVVSGFIEALQVSGSSYSVEATSRAKGLNETTDDVLRVVQMTDSTNSVNIVSSIGLNLAQVSGSAWSVSSQALGLNETTDGVLRVVQMTDSVNSVNVVSGFIDALQVSGHAWSVSSQALGKNETTDGVLRAVLMTDSTSSVYITGSSGTTVIVGDVISDAADTGDAPVKIGGIARTANPTAVAAGDRISATYDDVGRMITKPLQIRDLVASAYVSLATGTNFGVETTLLASGAGTFLDLIYVMGTNDSDAAVTADLRASTGGTVLMSVRIPANGTAGVALPVPVPGPSADHTWTVDLPDISGTNVTVSALFSKEV